MEDKKDVIDLRVVFKKIRSKKRLFIKTLSAAFILSCIWIFPQPRYYTASISLAPETDNMSSGGTLGSIASSFGINLGTGSTSDAIYPTLYPELMDSPDFIVTLFDIKVKNEDGDIETDYYTYLKKHQKVSIWSMPAIGIGKLIRTILPKEDKLGNAAASGNKIPFILSEDQHAIVEKIKDNVTCNVDKKTDVITITVKDQDRLICATMADSVRVILQNFITDYRTRKARIDLEYYTKLAQKSKGEYEEARRRYADFSDANTDITLVRFKSKLEDLENDMQLKYNSYTTMNTQMEIAKAKVQERTPAFTILQCATVPQKPAGPKRMLFVFAIMFMTLFGTVIYIFKGDVIKQLTSLK